MWSQCTVCMYTRVLVVHDHYYMYINILTFRHMDRHADAWFGPEMHAWPWTDGRVHVELESVFISSWVRPIALSLFCLDSTQLLSCLSNSMVEHLPSKQYAAGSNPTQAALCSIFMEVDVHVS